MIRIGTRSDSDVQFLPLTTLRASSNNDLDLEFGSLVMKNRSQLELMLGDAKVMKNPSDEQEKFTPPPSK